MALVEFTKDCYPYCKGDRIDLTEEEIKDVDALAEQREISKPYTVVENPDVPAPTGTIDAVEDPAGERVAPVEDQASAEANLTAPGVEATQAAEAERTAKAAAKKSK